MMRMVLHDWSNSDCAQILANLRTAFGNAMARLIIVEVGQTLSGYFSPILVRSVG